MEYDELLFRAKWVEQEHARQHEDALRASAFNAWQMLTATAGLDMDWQRYQKKLGLIKGVKRSKEDIKREVDDILARQNEITGTAVRQKGF